jgi:maltose O-acetyltransferase
MAVRADRRPPPTEVAIATTAVATPPLGPVGKLRRIVVEDTTGVHVRLLLARLLDRVVPHNRRWPSRAALVRLVGFGVGEGTTIGSVPRINGPRPLKPRLVIGEHCVIGRHATFDLMETITLQDRVTLGPRVMILTSSHELGPKEMRAGSVVTAPVVIERGATIGRAAVILPGVTIGAGASVADGSLVNKDVAPGARVAGTPAKVVTAG